MSNVILETKDWNEVNQLFLIESQKSENFKGDFPKKLKEGVNLSYCIVKNENHIDVEYRSPTTNKIYSLEEIKRTYGKDIFEMHSSK